LRRKAAYRARKALEREEERLEPESREPDLASAVGNRALSAVITTAPVSRLPRSVAMPAGIRVLARDTPKAPAPVKPDDPPKVNFPEADKERARKMVVAPLRAVAEKLAAGEKADIGWVLRHLKPIPAAMDGVNWPDDVNTIKAAYEALDDFDLVLTALKSMKLDHRHVVTAAVHRWHGARKLLQDTKKEIQAAKKASERAKEPAREGAEADVSALTALQEEIDAVCQDLVKAPHSQEGVKDVAETAGAMLDQFDTIQPNEAAGVVEQAKGEFEHGLATLVPLAEGKEEAIKHMQGTIVEMADRLAAVLGDAPPAGDPSVPDDDPPVQVPAPGSLPPPKPPPPGSTPPPKTP
jgi:hypothetical protein